MDTIENKVQQLKELSKKEKKLNEIAKDIADILGNANMDEKKEIAEKMSKTQIETINQKRNLQFIVPHVVKELYEHEGPKGGFSAPKKPIITPTPIIESVVEPMVQKKKPVVDTIIEPIVETEKTIVEPTIVPAKKEKKPIFKRPKKEKKNKIQKETKEEISDFGQIMEEINKISNDLQDTKKEREKIEKTLEDIQKEKKEIEDKLKEENNK